MLIPDELRDLASRFPDRVAVRIDGTGESMTFADWDARSNALARGLVEAGLMPGERVVLFLTNESALTFHVSYFAIHKAGGVVVPVNPRYAPREIEHILESSGASMLVTAGEPLERARTLRATAPALRLVIAPGATGSGEADWDALAAGDPAAFQVAVDEDALADILYTSGTTGLPKGVASSHRNATFHNVKPIEKGGTFLHSIPLSTFFGSHGTQLFALRLGLTNIVLPSFDPHRFAQLVEEARPSWVVMVPAQALLLLESGSLGKVDTSSVRTLMFASAPMPPHAIAGLGEAFPKALLLNGYGLTEGGGSACMMPPGEALVRPGSVGKPLPGVTVRVIDDEGKELPIGETGEITLKIPTGDRAYFNDPEATAATWRDGWVHTGDIGHLDDDGYLYVSDRKKDMIIRGGYNVYCIEVESALFDHPDIVEVAVVGTPHEVLGQDVCAVVRLREGATLDLDAARAFLTDRLADYKLPRRLVVREEPLPRSAMSKVDKKALLAELAGTGAAR